MLSVQSPSSGERPLPSLGWSCPARFVQAQSPLTHDAAALHPPQATCRPNQAKKSLPGAGTGGESGPHPSDVCRPVAVLLPRGGSR